MLDVDRRGAGYLTHILSCVLGGHQRDQQHGGGGAGQDADPLVPLHQYASCCNIGTAVVYQPSPGQDHWSQVIHLALQPGGVPPPNPVNHR